MGRIVNKVGGIGGLLRLAALFFWALSAACANTDARSTVRPASPVTLTIGYSHVTGEDQLHGIQQASRLIGREGLTLPNREGRVQARIAESWSESADGLTWRFKLRSNALFHDGSQVDAEAVKRSLERSLATSDIDQFPGLADIVSIEAPNPAEVIIRLKDRSTFLLDDLGVSILKFEPGGAAIGTGPYVTVSNSSNALEMKAFDKYYRGSPQVDRIVWRAYPAVRTAWAAMMRGDIDFLYEIAPETLEFVEPETSVQVFPFLRNYDYAVVFNSKRPMFAKGEVRRALNYSIDRSALVEKSLRGRGQPTSGPAWPLHWAYDPTIPGYAYDPPRATALLDAAGVPHLTRAIEAGRVPARLRFVCLIPNSFVQWERMALIVQRDLAEIGVDMQIEAVPFEEFNRRIAARDFDAVFLEFIVGNSPSRPYTFWYSKSKQNVWGYANPLVDRALDGIRRASTDAEYRDAFRRFQVESLNDPPAIFLALGQSARAVNKRFQVVSPPGNDILPSIANWRPSGVPARSTN